ncbi:hypothetical protein ACFQL4_28720 [Halosimplex aquaticum]
MGQFLSSFQISVPDLPAKIYEISAELPDNPYSSQLTLRTSSRIERGERLIVSGEAMANGILQSSDMSMNPRRLTPTG